MDNVIKEAFLAATADPEFHEKWMTADTWAELTCLQYNLVDSNAFTGIQLNKVFQSRGNLHLMNQMDVDRNNARVIILVSFEITIKILQKKTDLLLCM